MQPERKREPSQSHPQPPGLSGLYGTGRARRVQVMQAREGAESRGGKPSSWGYRQDLVSSRLLESGFLEG